MITVPRQTITWYMYIDMHNFENGTYIYIENGTYARISANDATMHTWLRTTVDFRLLVPSRKKQTNWTIKCKQYFNITEYGESDWSVATYLKPETLYGKGAWMYSHLQTKTWLFFSPYHSLHGWLRTRPIRRWNPETLYHHAPSDQTNQVTHLSQHHKPCTHHMHLTLTHALLSTSVTTNLYPSSFLCNLYKLHIR